MRKQGLMHNKAPYCLLHAGSHVMQQLATCRCPLPAAFSVIPERKENVTFVG